MRGIELKHIGVRSFMLKGLTARWGIDGNRPPIPPALRTALVAWYNTEIQRATNFDVIESYLLDMNAGVLHPENATATLTGQKLHITNVVNVIKAIHEVIASVAGAELVLNVTGLSSTIRARAGTLIGGKYTFYPLTNGVNRIPGAASGSTFFFIEGLTAGTCDITIEQLPTSKLTDLSGNGHHLYLYGFTGSDNIVDNMLQHTGTQYGVSYGQPILTDYTVCSTREWADMSGDRGFASKRDAANGGAFVLDKSSLNGAKYAYSFSAFTPITFAPAGFTYQSKTSYNGSTVIVAGAGAGAGVDQPVLTVGGGLIDARTGAVSEFFKGGYKSFVLFNRTLTTEELAYVERWMA